MAAIDTPRRPFGRIVMAALAVQGVVAPGIASAETADEKGVIALRYLYYRDMQKVVVNYPGYDGTEPAKLKRITVNSPSVHVRVPVTPKWTVEGSAVLDDVSGATPRYYSDVSGASTTKGMSDSRKAGDVRVSRHFERGGVSVGASHSSEHDYRSTGVSVEGRIATPDNNTTFTLGAAHASDRVSSTLGNVTNEPKRTHEIIAGVTRAVTANDLVQLNLTYADGKGYFTDPYKRNDNRPDRRKQAAALVAWNHHFGQVNGTLRSSYRYYRDSFGIAAHTVEGTWVQPINPWLSLAPSLRYHTQSSASFYYDPVMDAAYYPRPIVPQHHSSTDQRLSAFGAVTFGLKAELRYEDWTTDVKYERYEQRGDWRAFGSGSPNIDPFSADSVQVGVSRKF